MFVVMHHANFSVNFLEQQCKVWWFGVVLLARGPALSLPAVVATNMPGLHLCLMLAILKLGWLLVMF